MGRGIGGGWALNEIFASRKPVEIRGEGGEKMDVNRGFRICRRPDGEGDGYGFKRKKVQPRINANKRE